MALRQAKLCSLLSRSGSALVRQNNAIALVSVVGQRHLTTNPKYVKPFDYKKKNFSLWNFFTDFTSSRLNENSRIIMIEGPPGVGKSELAKTLAERFKLLYIPGVTEEDLFKINDFDTRKLNDILPSKYMMRHDLNMLYSDQGPEGLERFASTQVWFFNKRLSQYVAALRHVLHTGQGVVLENSVWSDAVYALTMAEYGYMTKKAISWYMYNRKNSLLKFWKPHLSIYLDAPSSTIVKNLKDKNPQYEGSPALTEEYFDTLRNKYKQMYLPFMSTYLDTLEYDSTNLEDIDLLTLDLEGLDLIGKYGDSQFMDWRQVSEETYTSYRYMISSNMKIEQLTTWDPPMDCPELWMDVETGKAYEDIRLQIPQLGIKTMGYWYDKEGNFKNNPELSDVTPLSLAKDSVYAQGVLEAGPESKKIEA